MKKLIIAVPLFFISFNTFATEPVSKIINKPVLCFKLDDGLNYLKAEYGETIKRKLGINDYFQTEFYLLENDDKGTWTVLEYRDDVGCVVASGKGDKKV